MATSKIKAQQVSRWAMGLMAVAIFLMPAGFTPAQDYDAVIKRLRKSVAAREISVDQADAMIGALKNSTANKLTAAKPTVKSTAKLTASVKFNWDEIRKEIEGAVKAGKITREQADAKYLELKKKLSQKPAAKKGGSSDKPNWDEIKKEIEGAVKAGKITREQADAKYLEFKKKLSQKPAVKKAESKPKSTTPAKPTTKIRELPQIQRNIQKLEIRNLNDAKKIYVTENERKITIHDDPEQGILIEITDTKDGKPVTHKFRAKNTDELHMKNPEAYKLYQKYLKSAPSGK